MLATFPVERTRKNYPALWEEGGGYTNTGDARIIAGPRGEQLKPLYIRRRGPLAGGQHALFVVWPGCYIIVATRHKDEYEISVYKIVKILETAAVVECEYEYSRGEWNREPPEYLAAAIQAAREKAACYHCREPHYCMDP
jgi:hypothetical protein